MFLEKCLLNWHKAQSENEVRKRYIIRKTPFAFKFKGWDLSCRKEKRRKDHFLTIISKTSQKIRKCEPWGKKSINRISRVWLLSLLKGSLLSPSLVLFAAEEDLRWFPLPRVSWAKQPQFGFFYLNHFIPSQYEILISVLWLEKKNAWKITKKTHLSTFPPSLKLRQMSILALLVWIFLVSPLITLSLSQTFGDQWVVNGRCV